MNCKAVRTDLLSAERPARPAAAAAAHLAGCADCRQWQQRLVELEEAVPRLPVPPSEGKVAFLLRLAREPAAAPPVLPTPGRLRRFLNSPALPPAALAASLLLFAFWWLGQGPSTNPQPKVAARTKPVPDRLLAHLMDRHLRLAKTNSARERVEVLAELAEDLRGETHALAGAAAEDDLQTLARLYKQVVADGLVDRAGKLDPKERRAVLDPILANLERVGADARDLAEKVPAAAGPLKEIAVTAEDGRSQLRQLLGGDKP